MKSYIKYLWYVLAVFIFATTVVSCSKDDDGEPSAVVGRVSILNNTSYTLDDFMVNFINDSNEIITRESKGTLKPKETVMVDIPIGATQYYMGTVEGGIRFWSPNYAVSVKNQVLTDQIVGNWSR